mgnify:FL=1
MNLQARLYDPVIGRFLAVDPLAEIQIGITPYHYCGNDPINASDPSGLLLSDRVIEEKEYIERTSHERLMQVISSLNRWDLEAIAMRQKVRNGMMHDLENYRDLADGGANSAYTDLFNSTNYVAAGAGGELYYSPSTQRKR